MSAPRPSPAPARSGLTLLELMVATLLAAILMTALLRLLDVSLDLWARGETGRQDLEQSATIGELFARDLSALHAGQQGDFLVEWHSFDVDGDEQLDRDWPRLRFVRNASAAELARLRAQSLEAAGLEGPAGGDPAPGAEAQPPSPPLPTGHDATGLIEVCWAVLPAGAGPDERGEGVLWRAERLLDATEGTSFLAENFFDSAGRPPGAVLNEVSGGVLWFGLQFATQTSVVHDGWRVGWELADAAASWDAWNGARPDVEQHPWNEAHPGMPAVDERPLLPRRVRLEMELESARDRRRRTRLLGGFDEKSTTLLVRNGEHLPRGRGARVLVGSEWMQIVSVRGDRVTVRRGVRSTRAVPHASGEMVHHGRVVVYEVPIPMYSDDWNL